MILGIGIDVVQNERIKEAIDRYGTRFINRIFTENEVSWCTRLAEPHVHFAARFAAKEAAFKAIGTGWAGGVSWRDVEVDRREGGPPQLRLRGAALEIASRLGVTRYHTSLTHDGTVSCAVVIMEA